MNNRDLAETFNLIADLLEVKGEVIYKILAYRKAADSLTNLGRDVNDVWKEGKLTDIPGVTCIKPKAALYLFPRLDPEMYPIEDDQKFVLEMLEAEKVLVVQGSGFNWPTPDHFRVVFLPNMDDLEDAIGRIARYLEYYRKRHGK